MRVVLSGIFYPVAIVRYFEQALRRRGDVELCTVGPFTRSWIPWNGGIELKPEYAVPPDLELPQVRGSVPIKFVEAKLPWQPDLWLQIDAGYHFVGRPSGSAPNFIVGTDPHCLNYDQSRSLADKFFCMQTPYKQEGDIWLPYAYDPIWHRPVERKTFPYDAGYVGAPYDNRVRLVKAIQAAGYKVAAPGYGPAYEEARNIYEQCWIGLNWSSLQDLTARVFEIMAMGLVPLVNRVPDLEKVGMVEGVHYYGFDSVGEAVQKMSAPAYESAEIARTAQEFVQPHTWDARVTEVLGYA
jgi:hypothetical protein